MELEVLREGLTGAVRDAGPEELRSLLDSGEFFWLDLVRPTWEHVAKLIEAAAERVTIPTDKQSPFA